MPADASMQLCKTSGRSDRKTGLPSHLLKTHMQSKKDTDSIKRWLCKNRKTKRAGHRTSRSIFIERARSIKNSGLAMTPYIITKFRAAIAGRQQVADYHKNHGLVHDMDRQATHDAFIQTLQICYDILSGRAVDHHPRKNGLSTRSP